MYLRKGKSNGKTYLSIVKGYRDKASGKNRGKVILSLGYLEKLEKEYSDPIAHFERVAEEMTRAEKENNPPLTITIDKAKTLTKDKGNRKNFGYAALSRIYHELELDVFFRNNSRGLKAGYNVSSIMKLLVYSRILSPASRKKTYEMKDRYFDKTDFSLDDVYRCLSFVNKLKDKVQRHINNKVGERYGRSCELVYYDVTNYYFEIDEADRLRKYGVSSEHSPNPIVQMGLFLDTNGIPVSYRLFPGSTNDCETLSPLSSELRREYNFGRVIVAADRGLNTQRNIQSNILNQSGYVYSQTVRGGKQEFKEYVLNEQGYRHVSEGFRIKSKIAARELEVTDIMSGRKSKINIYEKQVVFYSREYAERARAERSETILKAHDMVNNPDKYNRATSYGAAKYVKGIVFDNKTGEVAKAIPTFDYEKLSEDEKYDGYYSIVTSEIDKRDEEIIGIYKGLWKIEEA
ncbi:MAG: IS1634 family transposase, partial [Deferribacteraceae bacterium]|nr:IS1634 family transposase [Deferribacteraceae bacterium]